MLEAPLNRVKDNLLTWILGEGNVEVSQQELEDAKEAEKHIVDEGDDGQDFDESADADELLGW